MFQPLLVVPLCASASALCGSSYRRRALLNTGAALAMPLVTQTAAAKGEAPKSFIGKWKLHATMGPSADARGGDYGRKRVGSFSAMPGQAQYST